MIFDVSPKSDKFLEKVYEESMQELDEFFQLNWKRNHPNIFLVPDRKTIDALRSKKTEDWNIGWISGTDVYVLSKDNFEKESNHSYSDEKYKQLIKHELAHSFTRVFVGFGGKPKWLWEGLAIYLSGQVKRKTKPEKLTNFLDFYEASSEKDVYTESGFAVEFLVETYGKEKLLKLLKSLKEKDTKEAFAEKFRDIYGFDLSYDNFRVL